LRSGGVEEWRSEGVKELRSEGVEKCVVCHSSGAGREGLRSALSNEDLARQGGDNEL